MNDQFYKEVHRYLRLLRNIGKEAEGVIFAMKYIQSHPDADEIEALYEAYIALRDSDE